MWTTKNITDQTGKTVIITGANTGIGYETALALYNAGAHIILACRDLGKANEAIARLQQHNGKGVLEASHLDLTNLDSVKQFTDAFVSQHTKLDVLINNAGVMLTPASKTANGFELQFGVNFLGHYALTGYLYPLLKATSNSRVVTVSSNAYLSGAIDFDNLKSEHSYDAFREYAQSKLANILFSKQLQRRIEATKDNVASIAVQPGANKTNLSRHMSPDAYNTALERVGELMEPWQGALPSLFAAVDPEAQSGRFYGPDQDGGYRGYPGEDPISAAGMDETVAKKLWQLAEEVTGITYP
ncbi:oxidoreductase [Flavobacterium subsaxonicum]|uniref:Short-chain dehydrogenase n=1 Tax=Flavobacterium subsaxonicum WB 4.1-42 = DSM 21790 TaxID=1121898 RepID=A0A0A2N158_9FLAO|nr:oxidoreductase [Flavobacterium subsaxonicum]KGO94160.1 short-chain dehydrogenase [Flavobacterium subsaxonicum WB 4.1-42 = DSM 21790]